MQIKGPCCGIFFLFFRVSALQSPFFIYLKRVILENMPILDIELVASDSPLIPSTGSGQGLPVDLTQSLADAAAKVFGAEPGRVWVKLRITPSAHYAENGGLPEGVQPVFVTVLESRVPKGSALDHEVAQLTKVIAKVLDRRESNVHIFYQPDGAGRVAFGGKLVK